MVAQKTLQSLPYREGDWFAVPLRNGGYALGVAARMNGKGKVLGYFFGPRHEQVPALRETVGLRAGNACYISFFGDLGLIDGKWPVLGRSDLWRRELWPLPFFCRYNPDLDSRAFRVEYSEDALAVIDEAEISPEGCQQMPRDGLSGFGAIEKVLTHLLSRKLE